MIDLPIFTYIMLVLLLPLYVIHMNVFFFIAYHKFTCEALAKNNGNPFIFGIFFIYFENEGAKLPIREHKQLAQRLLLLMFHKEKKGSIASCYLKFLKKAFLDYIQALEKHFSELLATSLS